MGAACAHQAVLGVVAEGGGAVGGEVAVGVPGVARAPDLGVLVAAVDGVALGRARERKLVRLVREQARDDLARGVEGEAEGGVVAAARAVEVVRQRIEPGDRIVAVAGDRARGVAVEFVAAQLLVIEDRGERGRGAVLRQVQQPVGVVVDVLEERAVRMGEVTSPDPDSKRGVGCCCSRQLPLLASTFCSSDV